ncbi:MAG: IMP dehydrogenase [Mycoplasma sp.]
MAKYIKEVSRTFNEYLLVPGLTRKDCTVENISTVTPLVKFKKGEEPKIKLNIPMTSAVMQSVSGPDLAIALAREGGVSFIFGSQSIQSQARMIRIAKNHKAGFVKSDTNIRPDQTLAELLELKEVTGHATTAVTEDGTINGKLVGIVTSRDYRISRMSLDTKIETFMTPFEKLIFAYDDITLSQANDILWENKLNALPIIDRNQRLKYFVFRKDYNTRKKYTNELNDEQKRYIVGAGVNTKDYETRIPALVEAGADVLAIDSSDGFTEYQADTIKFVREKYGDNVKIGAGNVVDEDGFNYLADAGADFIKVGIGGGSICITREQKGIGRGQASAIQAVVEARDKYLKEKGVYIPICSDGGIVYDYHMTLALAMGADFLMLGRYFARFDEAPGEKLSINGSYVKEYWGEGSNRAKNWQRYDLGGKSKLNFEEGVDSYVPYAGLLSDNVRQTMYKIKSTMSNCGVMNIKDLHENAKLTLVSATSIVEGGAHDVIKKDNSSEMK